MTANKRGLQRHEDWAKRVLPIKDDIEKLYVSGDLSQRECADIFGVSQSMFGRWVKMLGFETKSKACNGSKNGRYRDGTEARPYLKLVVRRQCSVCQTSSDLVIHHKDGNHMNNSLDNLQVMCRSCHTSYHKRLYWQQRKDAIDGR